MIDLADAAVLDWVAKVSEKEFCYWAQMIRR